MQVLFFSYNFFLNYASKNLSTKLSTTYQHVDNLWIICGKGVQGV